MSKQTIRKINILILVITLLSAPLIGEASPSARPALRKALQKAPQTTSCNVKRRALIGAAIGAAAGMVVVRKAAAANDGTIGVKVTLQAGGYGAALGALLGLRTCP
jgi:hypothetical protein